MYEVFLYALSIPLLSHIWTLVKFSLSWSLALGFFLPYTTFIECFLDQSCALMYAFVRASLASLPKCFMPYELSLFIYLSPIEVKVIVCWLQALESHGYHGHCIPILDFHFINLDLYTQLLRKLDQYLAIVFTSPRAVQATQLALNSTGQSYNTALFTVHSI